MPDKYDIADELEDLVEALYRASKGDANFVRRTVERILVELDPAQQNYKKLQDQYRHCFIEEATAGPVKSAYCDVYIGNLIDAARGKE